MRAFLILTTLILSTSIFAQSRQPAVKYIQGEVVEIYCGEVDPYIVGDACISYILTADTFFGVVTDGYVYKRRFPKSYGKLMKVNTNYLRQIKRRDVLMELKYINRDAFYLYADSIKAFTEVK